MVGSGSKLQKGKGPASSEPSQAPASGEPTPEPTPRGDPPTIESQINDLALHDVELYKKAKILGPTGDGKVHTFHRSSYTSYSSSHTSNPLSHAPSLIE